MKKIHLSSVDSTNTYLKENYKRLDNFTFVSTDEQLKGRGRNKREWKSENGKNLLFSLLILEEDLFKYYKEISIITAYSIIEVLKELSISGLMIKWPNDIFINDKKVCGILLEALTTSKQECLIVGIGLNVNQREFEGVYIIEPTSLAKTLNRDIDVEELKDKIYNQLLTNLEKLKEGFDFYPLIKAYDYLKDKEAFVELDGKEEKIQIVRINNDYSLLANVDGIERTISFGEVSFHNKKVKKD